jgi:gliding motility-associated-like protein
MQTKISTFLLILIFPLFVNGLDYYWVGGNGDWTDINHWATSSGGSLKHIQTPTPSDNVYFDANSSNANFAISMNIPVVVCRTLHFGGLTKGLNITGVVNDIRLYGGLTLSNKVTWSVAAKFSFESQQTGNQIVSNNCQMPFTMNFLSSSGGWILNDSLTSNFNIYLVAGALNTNGNKVRIHDLISHSSLNRSLILGSTILILQSFDVDGQGFTANAGTSHIYPESGYFQVDNCQNQSFYDVTFSKTAQIVNYQTDLTFHHVKCYKNGSFYGNNTYDKLILSKGYFYSFYGGTSHTFNVDLVANGDCSDQIHIFSSSSSATFQKTSGSINVIYIHLKNIVATGGASFNAYSSFDYGGNIGWNIIPTQPRTLYWVGGTGYWSDSVHWSLSSGGIGGECIPTLIDNVIFNDNSFIGVGNMVSIVDSAGNCHDMTWNTSKMPVFFGGSNMLLRISGSMYWCQQMVNDFHGDIIFVSKDLGEYVQTSNHHLLRNISFDGFGGWTLLDTIYTPNNVSVDRGKLFTNNQYIYAQAFSAPTNKWKELYLSNSLIEVTTSFSIRQDSTFINPGKSTVVLLDSGAIFKTTNLPHRYLWNVVFKEDAYLDSKNTHFNKIIYRKDIIKRNFLTVDSIYYSAGCDYQLHGVDTVISYLKAQGYCTKKITLRAEHPMTQFKIVKVSGNITVHRVHMRGIVAQGGANFIAINSSDLGNNSGWFFSNQGTELFWIGGNGTWNDSLHWSYSSGGSGGACIPTINDTVYFDNLSFSGNYNEVMVLAPNAFCRDMVWSSNLPSPIFSTPVNANLFIAGNLFLTPSMKFDYKGYIYFCDTSSGKTIHSGSNDLDTTIFFIDNGQWSLLDSMNVKELIVHYSGEINTMGKKLSIRGLNSSFSYPKSMNISNSIVWVYNKAFGSWVWNHHASASFFAANSNVNFFSDQSSIVLTGIGSVNFHNIYFRNYLSNSVFQAAPSITNFNNKVHFFSSGSINGDHSYDTLIFSAGKNYQLKANNTQTINKLLSSDGFCSKRITIVGNGGVSSIYKATGLVEINEVDLYKINAQGQAVFNAYGGNDLGSNSNWNFYPNPPRTLYWVGGNGSWSDSSHWALSSGGQGGECLPTRIDDVIIDSNSTSTKSFNTLIIPPGSECLGFQLNDIQGVFLDGVLDVYAGLNIGEPSVAHSFHINFYASTPLNIIKTSQNLIHNVVFHGTGGWYLYDDLNVSDSIIFNRGFLDTRNKNIFAYSFNSVSNSKKKLDMRNSTITLEKRWNMNIDSLTLLAQNSNIQFEGINANGSYIFVNQGLGTVNYYNVSINEERIGKSYFYNYDTATVRFNKLTVYNDGIFYNIYDIDSLMFAPGNTYKLQHGMTQKVNLYWQIRGNNCYAINLESTKMFETAYVTKPSNTVTGDFLNIRDIHALGACTYYAGAFSTDISNNMNWLFINGPNYVYGLGQDTNFNIGSNVVLSTVNFNGTQNTLYNWSTGSTHDTIVVNQIGWYSVTVSYASDCQVVDSIFVGCKLTLNYQIHHNPCFGDSVGVIYVLIPDTSYSYQFLWLASGDTSSFINQLPAGNYLISVAADGGKCQVTDTVEVLEPPKVLVPQGDTSFCESDSVLLNLGNFSVFYWDDNFSSGTRWVSSPDTFFVSVEDYIGCKSDQDTIIVGVDSIPYVNLGLDTFICLDQVIILSPGYSFDSYIWNSGSQDSNLLVKYPGIYWVTIRQNTCVITDSIVLENCPPILEMPNIFTPNGDGFNDQFRPEEDNIVSFNMKIYNRWGMQIFQTDDLKNGWDGTTLGLEASDGVYLYVIEYREWLGTEPSRIYTAQGTVTLLRTGSN